MAINNVSHITSVEKDFDDPMEINQHSSYIPSTSLYPTFSPSMMHPTPPPIRIHSVSLRSTTQTQELNRKTSVVSNTVESETIHITNYMLWSQINLILGAIILGIPALLLARQINKLRENGDVKRAKILSRIALALNIFVSFVFVCAMLFLLIYYSYLS